MQITIQSIDDQTPKGLTTGFRLRMNCLSPDGKSFVLGAAVLVSKTVIEKRIPLPNLIIAALEKSGLEECTNELFVDTRRLNLDAVPLEAPALPRAVTLGGMELLNQKALTKLTGSA